MGLSAARKCNEQLGGKLNDRSNIKVARFLSFSLLGILSISLCLEGGAQLGRRPAQDYIAVLENPDRVARLKPDQIIARLNLMNGDVVADVGAGSGVFTRRFVKAVGPKGKVYAVDIDKELLKYNREQIGETNLSNVEFILGEFDDPKLPAEPWI